MCVLECKKGYSTIQQAIIEKIAFPKKCVASYGLKTQSGSVCFLSLIPHVPKPLCLWAWGFAKATTQVTEDPPCSSGLHRHFTFVIVMISPVCIVLVGSSCFVCLQCVSFATINPLPICTLMMPFLLIDASNLNRSPSPLSKIVSLYTCSERQPLCAS